MKSRFIALASLAVLSVALFAADVRATEVQQPAAGAQRPAGGQRTPARAGRLPAPEAPRGTAILRGQVVAIDTGTPIRRAQVRVGAQGVRESRLATTDAQGRFEIRDLAAGRYTMTASKGGFVSLQYGQRRPGESGTPLELADGQALDKLVIGLPRGSVIGGRVTDEYGEPIANATVTALRYAYTGGARRLVPAGARQTDDQGSYRLFGLPPGDYLVSANLRTGEVTDPGDDTSGYAPTYFPGTPNVLEAQRVRVALAEENNSVSFGLIATRLVSLSGQVVSSTGGQMFGGVVFLASAGGTPDVGMFRQGGGGRVDGNGAFRIGNVAPGRYLLQARTALRGDGEFARMDITVGGDDVEGITLVTSPAGRASGTIVTDTGDRLPASAQSIRVVTQPATPDAPGGGGFGGGFGGGPRGGGQNTERISADGAFELGNLTDPRYVRVNAPQGWTLKNVTLNGQDVTDLPLDVQPGQHVTGLQVVITQKISAATGTVVDARSEPVLDATVVMFPLDERLRTFQSRFVKAARPNQEGTFSITEMPPGEYLAVAVQGVENGQAGDPEFLAAIEPMATRVSIKEGEKKTVNLALSQK